MGDQFGPESVSSLGRNTQYQMLLVGDEPSSSLPFSGKEIRLDERIVAFLLGDRLIDGRISDIVSR